MVTKKKKSGKADKEQEQVSLGFTPHKHQLSFMRNWKRFNELICCRRFGKSVTAALKLTDSCLRLEASGRKKQPKFAYIAPQKDQAKQITWPIFKEFLHPLIQRNYVRIDNQSLEIHFARGAQIKLYAEEAGGAESIRGNYLDGVVLDEADKMDMDTTWLQVVGPALEDTKGWALFAGTIEGKGNLYNIHEEYKYDDEWNIEVFRFEDVWQDLPAYCDYDDKAKLWVPSQYKYDSLKKRYKDKPNAWAREYDCDWDADGSDQFIPSRHIAAAQNAKVSDSAVCDMPVVAGLDCAGQGDDSWSLCVRQGASTSDIEIFATADEMAVVDIILERFASKNIDMLFIDNTGGYGAGVISRLKQLGYGDRVAGINFGSSPRNNSYADKRTEMYADARDWLAEAGNRIPDDKYLAQELGAQEGIELKNGKVRLIPKDKIRQKINRSPDRADSFVLTFAMPVHSRKRRQHSNAMTVASTGYNPINSRWRGNAQQRSIGYGILR